MNPQWTKHLRALGFTDSEAKTYLTSIETGPSSVQDLARKARISRVTAYAAIEELMRSGLMSTMQRGKKQLYQSESPERLRAVAQERARSMQALAAEIDDAVADLKLVQRGEKPIVKMFEGKEALKAIQDDLLASGVKALDEMYNGDDIYSMYSLEELQPVKNELGKRKTFARTIVQTIRPVVSIHALNPVLQLPVDTPEFHGDVLVYGNKVALTSLRGKQISVLIESADIAQTMRAMYEMLWRALESKQTPITK
ncbi:MAG: helix-turn-helix domain-containing protein [Patescibacteria group bacterium]